MKLKKNKILLPRGYLSYSALQLWESSKPKYWAKYYYGEEGFQGGKEMQYGKRFAEAIESGEDEDILISAVSSLIPKYPKIEFEIKVEFNGMILLGKLDSFDPKTKSFLEYKTGKTHWTQAKVNADDQITTYFMLIYLKYKKIPKYADLIWFQTEEIDGKIKFVGTIETFRTTRTITQILRMANKFKTAALEISKDYSAQFAIPMKNNQNGQRTNRKMARNNRKSVGKKSRGSGSDDQRAG